MSFLPALRSFAFTLTVYAVFPVLSTTFCVITTSFVPAASVICATTSEEIVPFVPAADFVPVLTTSAFTDVLPLLSVVVVTVTVEPSLFAVATVFTLLPSGFVVTVVSVLLPSGFVLTVVSVLLPSGFVTVVSAALLPPDTDDEPEPEVLPPCEALLKSVSGASVVRKVLPSPIFARSSSLTFTALISSNTMLPLTV